MPFRLERLGGKQHRPNGEQLEQLVVANVVQ
jgi:hypothetical protein